MTGQIPGTSNPGDNTISDLLNTRRISNLQLLVVGLVAAIMVLEGLSLQILAYVTPTVLADWHVTKLQFSPAIGMSKFGMAAGALIGCKFGDWWGRKPVLICTVFLFSMSTAVSSSLPYVRSIGRCQKTRSMPRYGVWASRKTR
ncbi:hypothetical protein VVT58_01415 [Sphingobium sp. SJ10-10]|uniref:hypothetical protein n=1 Tax=Sphingobium sp. SJ10-10 TaxID=3114999 RepID=UPI002E183154|nr:hypothetical protein [Sphingobium sp. SJ10-10]